MTEHDESMAETIRILEGRVAARDGVIAWHEEERDRAERTIAELGASLNGQAQRLLEVHRKLSDREVEAIDLRDRLAAIEGAAEMLFHRLGQMSPTDRHAFGLKTPMNNLMDALTLAPSSRVAPPTEERRRPENNIGCPSRIPAAVTEEFRKAADIEAETRIFTPPSREWLLRMAEAEDACGGILSVGGWVVSVKEAERVERDRLARLLGAVDEATAYFGSFASLSKESHKHLDSLRAARSEFPDNLGTTEGLCDDPA